ncbi:MAG: MgtC/SapB family protein [Ruminococcaceae bacterium]|nr:MgtC/SapB family protein [Oscillospiraceae bacterium]
MEYREVTYLAVALRIVVAVLCGGALGLERGLKHRPAGMRTYMLVCVGACLVMLTNQYLFQVTQTGDPMRLGAQVVSGIGFLGAGTIVVTRYNRIKGLTTAAGLWSAAGVGLALGVGFYEAALIAGFAIFVVMTLLQRWDDNLHSKTRAVEIYVELADGTTMGYFISKLRELELEISNVQIEQSTAESNSRGLIATLKAQKRCDHSDLMEKIRAINGVRYLEEL